MAAKTAFTRIVYHYGARPEFVVLGGLELSTIVSFD